MRKALLLMLALLSLALSGCIPQGAPGFVKVISFSGYQWQVKLGKNLPPGGNNWSDSNAWVDSSGYLHLRISQDDNQWYCAEVITLKKFGFGRYQFLVIGQIDQLDKNVILGMFNYPETVTGPSGNPEIDIEVSRWGDTQKPNGNYTVWPGTSGLDSNTKTFEFALTGTYTTQRFTWNSQEVYFQSLHGHQDGDNNLMAAWDFTPDDYLNTIPQYPMPVHINLWLRGGHPPAGQVEVVIKQFTYSK